MDKEAINQFETLRWETLEALYRRENQPTEWARLYMVEFLDEFKVDEDAWYLTRRGAVAARVVGDNPENARYGGARYAIEYIDYSGRTRRALARAGELRKVD
jgi:hypothetical protein